MSEHVWTENTKPDRPGIWQNKKWVNPSRVTVPETCVTGDWCFLMDLPDIKDPPKYRDVRKGDEGEEIEVDGGVGFKKGHFCFGVSPRGNVAYETKGGGLGAASGSRCRILDDGQPAKQPREWWVRNDDLGGGLHCAYTQKPNYVRDGFTHVREVID